MNVSVATSAWEEEIFGKSLQLSQTRKYFVESTVVFELHPQRVEDRDEDIVSDNDDGDDMRVDKKWLPLLFEHSPNIEPELKVASLVLNSFWWLESKLIAFLVTFDGGQ